MRGGELMPRRPSGLVEEASPLRRARLARNWTLEAAVEEIDLRTPGGHSGVTPSMVSGWELGRHTTSIGHRKMLCEIYAQPPEVLFAHQDRGWLPAGSCGWWRGSRSYSGRCWPRWPGRGSA
jgi:transcriptional regulator with XRE-family HTH domain